MHAVIAETLDASFDPRDDSNIFLADGIYCTDSVYSLIDFNIVPHFVCSIHVMSKKK